MHKKILLDSAETMVRRNFIALNTSYRKDNSHINDPSFYLNKLEKQEKINPKFAERKK